MRGNYLAKFYINGRYTEETIFALNTMAAKNLIESRYFGVKFRWASLPQLRHNSISRF